MVELTPFCASDAPTLLAWIPDDEFLIQWAGSAFVAPLDRAQLDEFRKRAARETPPSRLYRVTRPGRDEMIGYAELGSIDLASRSARLSRLLIGPDQRGTGLGSAMVEALLAVAFDEMALHRVALGVFDFNQGAIRCYQKAGLSPGGDAPRVHEGGRDLVEFVHHGGARGRVES